MLQQANQMERVPVVGVDSQALGVHGPGPIQSLFCEPKNALKSQVCFFKIGMQGSAVMEDSPGAAVAHKTWITHRPQFSSGTVTF